MANKQAKCPACKTAGGMFEEKGKYVCSVCEQKFTAAQFASVNATNEIGAHISEAVRSIDVPESAKLYIETFFEDYDWADYNTDTEIYIPDLRIMVEKNKIKNPGNPVSWQLEAECLIVPLQHKLQALEDLQKTIFANHHGNINNVADEMATYNAVAAGLIKERDVLIKTLKTDLVNMERFGAEAEVVEAAREQITALEESLVALVSSHEVEDLPLVKKLSAENEDAKIKEYSQKGVNAVDCYESGLRAYNAGRYSDGVAYMAQVKDFRDASKYIRRMNSIFSFGDVVEAGGKLFKKAAHKAVISLENIKGGKKAKEEAEAAAQAEAEAEEAMGMLDYYEIKNGIIAEKPSITSVSELIRAYGDYIYFIKASDELCAYNVKSETVTTLDKAKYGYVTSNKDCFGTTSAGDKIYIKKMLEIEAFQNKGCFSFINRKKKEEEYNKSVQNNFSMITIDLARAEANVVIEKMVDNICTGNFVFFTVSEVVAEDKKKGKTYENIAKMCDLSTGKTDILFKKKCQILGVSGTKVVYDFWVPNSLNRQLRVIDHVTKEDIVLENNVYSYVTVKGGKVYYRVGTKGHSPLVSINLDGTERTEIIANYATNEIDLYCGWIYSWRGNMVIKTSKDGDERFILADDVKKIVERNGDYVYYIDDSEEEGFRIADADGSSNIRIGTGIAASDIFVSSGAVYYLRREWIGGKYGKSLYSMDLDGRNVKKLLFNITSCKKKPNSDEIYVLVKEDKTYNIKVQKDEWEETFPIDTYYSLDVKSGEMKELLVLGVPNAETYNREKKGCFGKKKLDNAIITEVEPEIDYGQITMEGGEAFGAIAALNAITGENQGEENFVTRIINSITGIFKKK